ncbi:TPA: nucleoside monophosphate kinase [archaeon]|nr:nucleoside monophosphate kinase [Candidatus Undinarchaeales archaeon SRR5007147.bin71]
MVVIIVGGPPGAGTTTVAKALAEHFGLSYVSTGDIFRHIAKERGISLNELNKTAEKEVDELVDKGSKEAGLAGDVVIDGDIAAWMNPDADFKLYFSASPLTRANRIFEDSNPRITEERQTLEEVKRNIEQRLGDDKRRYMEYYGIDLDNLSIYDLVIDTEALSVEDVIKRAIEYIEREGLGKDD